MADKKIAGSHAPKKSSALNGLPTLRPDIRLYGTVGQSMLDEFFRQQAQAHQKEDPSTVVLELTTSGGNADFARRIAQEVKMWREHDGCDIYFFGKTIVYSAGVTIMSAFPVEKRFVSADTVFLIHERHMEKQVTFGGALRSSLARARDIIAEIECGQRLEREGFMDLVAGSDLSIDDLMTQVMDQDWYVSAHEALKMRLVGGVV
ncbi:MAG: ATP-dependent Clp protease proteolytic subunit [Polaromonas sp.]|nr:ATP-dependent Clp protease proteolytic subunit [Polaromonas sp.]